MVHSSTLAEEPATAVAVTVVVALGTYTVGKS
jgi:hypothetical protein